MTTEPTNTPPAGGWEQFRAEAAQWWRHQPGKGFFFAALTAWVALFQFMGNSTLGYVNTPSLFGWWAWVCTRGNDQTHPNYLVRILNANESFCWFVLPLVLVLLWLKRAELQALPKRVWRPGLVLLLASLLLHIAGFMVQQTRISMVGFFGGLYALTGLFWGWRWLRATFFPMFLLAFTLPLGSYTEAITFPLRLLATNITVAFVHGALGIQVIQNGTSIWEPAGKFQYEVAAACSGIRSLTAIFVIFTIYSFLKLRTPWKRLLLIALAFPMTVLSNVVRLVTIVLAAQGFGQAAGNAVHESSWFSIVPYLPILVLMYFIGSWLREEPAPGQSAPGGTGPPAPEPSADAPLPSLRFRSPALIALGMIGLTASGLVWLQSQQRLGTPGVKVVNIPMHREDGQVASPQSVWLPEQVAGYTSEPRPMSQIVLDWLPKDTTYGHRRYRAQDRFEIECNVVLMGTDRTSIHQPQYCLTGSGWQIQLQETTSIPVAQPAPYALPVMKLTCGRQVKTADGQMRSLKAIYVYWFVADGQLTADHSQRMRWMARDLILRGTLQRWAYVSCFAICPPGHENATYERMKTFIAEATPQFQLTPAAR